jgi:hypothetical protein
LATLAPQCTPDERDDFLHAAHTVVAGVGVENVFSTYLCLLLVNFAENRNSRVFSAWKNPLAARCRRSFRQLGAANAM